MASIKERSPEVHLFLEMPADAVDVNVHPTKAEVRFREQSLVHEVVRRALMDALGQGGVPQLQLRPETSERARRCRWPFPACCRRRVSQPVAARPARLSIHRYQQRRNSVAGRMAQAHAPVRPDEASGGTPADSPMKPMIPLGQFRDTFIIAIDDEGVAIIDQHVAHERVLFERVMQALTAGRLASQRLLMPLVIEMSAAAHDALVGRATELEPPWLRS